MVRVLKSTKVRVLNLEFETLHRIGETEDFIYFANLEDESVAMYRKTNLELASNNIFAQNSLIEDVVDGKFIKVRECFQESYNAILKEYKEDE